MIKTRGELTTSNTNRIYQNEEQGVTGDILQEHLRDIIDSVVLQDEQFTTTVGTGGNYVTIYDAITDGKYNLLLVSDVIETNNISVNNNISINVQEFNLNLGVYNFTFTTSGSLDITGIRGIGKITFAYTVAKQLFNTLSNKFINVNNIIIDNNSTVANCPITSTYGNFKNIIAQLPNTAYGGFGLTGGYTFLGNISDSEIIGGGAICTMAISANTNLNWLDNLKFTGTFASNNLIAYIKNLKNTTFNITTTNGRINLCNGHNIYDIATTKTLMVNLQYNGVYVDISAKSIYSNGITGHCMRIYIQDGIVVEDSNVTLSDCWTDYTITVNPTADKTNISNCRTSTSIIDNGTNTILSNNQLI